MIKLPLTLLNQLKTADIRFIFCQTEALAATLYQQKTSCSQFSFSSILEFSAKNSKELELHLFVSSHTNHLEPLQASFLNCNRRKTLFHWSSFPWQIWFKAVLNIPKLKLLDHPSIQAWSFICFITKQPNHHCSSTALQIWWVFEFLHLPNYDMH